jgi:hypothetical protein
MLKGLFNKSDTKASDTKPAETTAPKSDKETKPSITTNPLLKGFFDRSDKSKK